MMKQHAFVIYTSNRSRVSQQLSLHHPSLAGLFSWSVFPKLTTKVTRGISSQRDPLKRPNETSQERRETKRLDRGRYLYDHNCLFPVCQASSSIKGEKDHRQNGLCVLSLSNLQIICTVIIIVSRQTRQDKKNSRKKSQSSILRDSTEKWLKQAQFLDSNQKSFSFLCVLQLSFLLQEASVKYISLDFWLWHWIREWRE